MHTEEHQRGGFEAESQVFQVDQRIDPKLIAKPDGHEENSTPNVLDPERRS